MINKFLVLSALILGVWSSSRLGANKCTWGPSHWCANVGNAKSCGKDATDFCKNKVWVGEHPLAGLTDPIPEEPIPENEQPKPKKTAPMAKLFKPLMGKYLQPKVGGNCALCELIGKKIFDKLKTNATEAEVVAEMEAICEYLPENYKQDCDDFVDEYGAMFYEEFVNDVSVHDLCSYLGLCSADFLMMVEAGDLVSSMLAKDISNVGCETCQAVMGLVQKEALANEKQLEALLDGICSKLPVDQDECTATVDTMFESFISLFESYNPKELCQMMSLCSSIQESLVGPGPVQFGQVGQTGIAAAEDVPLVLGGDDPCHEGPSFWCATPENARQCKMETYCKKKGSPLVF